MKTVGILVPLKKEAHVFSELLGLSSEKIVHGRPIYEGTLGNCRVVLVIGGHGKIRSAAGTQFLIDCYPVELVIHFGSAGALSKDLRIGDVVVGTEIIEHDYLIKFGEEDSAAPRSHSDPELMKRVLAFAADRTINLVPGFVVSGNEDVVDSLRRDTLFNQYQGLSVDWESSACAYVCNDAGIPVLVLRTIVDYAYEHSHLEFPKHIHDVSATLCRFVAEWVSSGRATN